MKFRPSRPLKAALLGLDHPHAPSLLSTLHNLREVGSVVVWGEKESFRALPHLQGRAKVESFTTDLDAVLTRPDIDFALVCVPTDRAAALSARVLAAGKHLLAEKPAGLNSREIRRLDETARRRGLKTCVLYAQRTHPAVQDAREIVAGGKIGPLLTFEGRMLTTQVRFRDPKYWIFRRDQAGGGIVTWLGCHYLDLLHFVSGEQVASVFARMATRSGEKIEVEDVAALTLTFRSGAVGTFHAGYVLAHSGSGYANRAGYDNYLGFNGRAGRVVWLGQGQHGLRIESPVKRGSPIRERTYGFRVSTSYGGAYGEAFVRQFLGAIQGRGDAPATLRDALRTALIVEAAQRSVRSGREEKVPSC